MRTKLSLTIDQADAVLAAARQTAAHKGVPMSIAVVDDAGALLALGRMDGARAYTADVATRKARTAAAVGIPTAVLEQAMKGRAPLSPDMIMLQGGLPVLHDGQCVGAVGVSGGPSEVDEEVAAAGIAALGA
jgi:glc operon protein GlcG